MNLHSQFPLPILLVEMSEAAWRKIKRRFRRQEPVIRSRPEDCSLAPGEVPPHRRADLQTNPKT